MMNFRKIPIRRQQILLLSVDLAILFVSLPIAALLRQAGGPDDLPPITVTTLPTTLLDVFQSWTGATIISMVVFVAIFFVFDLYSTERKTRGLRDFGYILLVSSLAVFVVPVFYFFFPRWKVETRGILVLEALFVGVAAFIWRAIYTRVHQVISRPRRILILGAGGAAAGILDEIQRGFRHELEVVGMIDDDPGRIPSINGYRILGGTPDLERVATETDAEVLVFAIPRTSCPLSPDLMADILRLKARGVEVYQMATFFKKITGRVPVEFVETSWLVFNQDFSASDNGPAGRLRRLMDILIAGGALLLLSPLVLAISIGVKLTSRGPVFFRQQRLGLNQRPYEIIKFRSMNTDAERGSGPIWSSGKADARVTPLGRFLRRTRMDEIPNFWNVLRGEMSVVGPRPERAHFVETLEREIPYYGLRFAVKPGLTGWAQVNHSYGASVDGARQKLEYEMFYIQERSFLLDLVILLKTAQTVLVRPGS